MINLSNLKCPLCLSKGGSEKELDIVSMSYPEFNAHEYVFGSFGDHSIKHKFRVSILSANLKCPDCGTEIILGPQEEEVFCRAFPKDTQLLNLNLEESVNEIKN